MINFKNEELEYLESMMDSADRLDPTGKRIFWKIRKEMRRRGIAFYSKISGRRVQ